MVKIPRAQESGTIRKEEIAPQIQFPSTFAEGGENIAKLGVVISGVAEKMQKLRDYRTEMESKISFSNKMRELEEKSLNDSDSSLGNQKKYFEEASQIKNDSLGMVENYDDRLGLQLAYDSTTAIAVNRMAKDFNKKEIKRTQEEFFQRIDTLKEDYYNSTSIGERNIIKKIKDKEIDNAVKVGIVSPKEKDNLKIGFNEGWKEQEFQRDVYGEPSKNIHAELDLAQLKLDQNIYGFDNKEKDKMQKVINQVRKKVEKEQKENIKTFQKTNETNLSLGLRQGKISLPEVMDAFNKREVSAEYLNTVTKWIQSDVPASPVLTDEQVYFQIAEATLSGKLDIAQLNKRILEEEANGKLNFYDANSLLELTALGDQATEQLTPEKMKESEIVKVTPRQSALSGALKLLKYNIPIVNLFEVWNDFQQRIKENKIKDTEGINKEVKEVIKDNNKKIKPDIETFNKNGQLMIDDNGNKAIVYPDGNIEEIN